MKIPKSIDFANVKEQKIFDATSSEYKAMDGLNEDNEWKDYCNEMLSKGTSVIYDATGDYFVVKPVGFKESKSMKSNTLKDSKSLNDKKVMNKFLKEDDDKFLLFDEDDPDNEENEAEVLPGKDVDDMDIESPVKNLTNIETELDNIDSEMSAATEVQPAAAPPAATEEKISVTSSELQRLIDDAISKRLGNSVNATVETQTPANDPLSTSQDVVEQTDGGDFLTAKSDFAEVQDKVGMVQDKVENDESYLDSLNGGTSNTEVVDVITEGDSELSTAVTAELDTESQNDFVCNGTVNFNGQPIQVQITGFVVTQPEVEQLAEAVSKYKGKLRKISSQGSDTLSLIIESNKKFYKVNYQDRPYALTTKPWSIKEFKFTSLNEAMKKIYSAKPMIKESNEQRFFKALVTKDIASRQMNDIKETDFLKEAKLNKAIPYWNIKSVGAVNLKNGLNETFSNITKHNPIVKNTLVRNKEKGHYFLLKGNLNESKPGMKKHLVDYNGKKDYGIFEVIGLYENSQRGLGQIMEKIQKTSILLFAYK